MWNMVQFIIVVTVAGLYVVIAGLWLVNQIHKRIHQNSETEVLKRCFEEKRRVLERQREQMLNNVQVSLKSGDYRQGTIGSEEVRKIDKKLIELAEEESTAVLTSVPPTDLGGGK